MAVWFVCVAIGFANCNRHFDNIDIAGGRLIANVTWPESLLVYSTRNVFVRRREMSGSLKLNSLPSLVSVAKLN